MLADWLRGGRFIVVKKTLMRIFALLVLLALTILGPGSRASADPARWLVRDKDTTIILFGTLHVLQPGTLFLSQLMKEDLKQVQTLFLEVPPGSTNPSLIGPLIQKYGLLAKPVPLNDRVGDQMTLAAKQAALGLGIDPRVFDGMRPWFIASTLTAATFNALGYRQENGVEEGLTKTVIRAGGSVQGFEDIEAQLAIFASLTPEEEKAVLADTLNQIADAKGFMERLSTAYVTGDADKVADILNQSFAATPGLYEKAIVARNRDWALKIETLMQRPGVYAIAVGAGHFSGKDNLLELLDLLAINVTRLKR